MTVDYFIVLFLVVYISIFVIWSVRCHNRIKKVGDFLKYVNNLSHRYSMVKNDFDYPFIGWEMYYNKLHSFSKLTNSFKPIKLLTFFTQDEIDNLFKVINEKPDTRY